MRDLQSETSYILSKRLAALLSGEAGAEILTTLQLLQQPYKSRKEAPKQEPAGPSRRIGVWSLEESTEVYRWDPRPMDTWRSWADVKEFPLRKTKPRIVLFGESVARGYLYDPVISVAKLLGNYLEAGRKGSYEIIDLAQTGINVRSLAGLMRSAACLEPDVAILFGGNNFLDANEYEQPDFEAILDGFDGGFSFTHEYYEHSIIPRICQRILNEFDGALPKAQKIVVIPEFNLTWRNDLETAFPVGPYKDIEALLDAVPRLSQALRQEDWATLFELCAKVESETEKTSYVPFYYRGLALLKQGKNSEAIDQLELAKDAYLGVESYRTPRCPAAVRRLMREGALQRQMDIIDLPLILRGNPPQVAGGEEFLDYCHLTLKGLHKATRPIAEAVLARQGNGTPLPDLYREEDDMGIAYFLAALYNAHSGQSRKTVHSRLERALKLDPTLADIMKLYVQYETSNTPRWLHKGFAVSTRDKLIERYLYRGNPALQDKFANFQIYEMVNELVSFDDGAKEAFFERLAASNEAPVIGLLIDKLHSQSFMQGEGFRHTAFYQSLVREDGFFLPLRQKGGFELVLDVRLPPRNQVHGPRELGIHINGNEVGSYEISGSWQRLRVGVPAELTKRGVNLIQLRWPKTFPQWEDFKKYYRSCIRLQMMPQVGPRYGHLFTFEAHL